MPPRYKITVIRKFFSNNGLSIALIFLFLITLLGQFKTGHKVFNEELRKENIPALNSSQYLKSGHFTESLFENWESEFLQMGIFVVLTIFLYQKGSSESKTPGEKEQSRFKRRYFKNNAVLRKLYENSLSIALLVIFIVAFLGHLYGGLKHENFERWKDGEPPIEISQFLWSDTFWFQSFQNWQSEFLSVAVIVIFSIFLRQKGSPQSKEVDAPHEYTKG